MSEKGEPRAPETGREAMMRDPWKQTEHVCWTLTPEEYEQVVKRSRWRHICEILGLPEDSPVECVKAVIERLHKEAKP